jgi:hypothetical protein
MTSITKSMSGLNELNSVGQETKKKKPSKNLLQWFFNENKLKQNLSIFEIFAWQWWSIQPDCEKASRQTSRWLCNEPKEEFLLVSFFFLEKQRKLGCIFWQVGTLPWVLQWASECRRFLCRFQFFVAHFPRKGNEEEEQNQGKGFKFPSPR